MKGLMENRATGLISHKNKAIQQENLSETARVAPFFGGVEAGGATVPLLFAMTSRLPNPRAAAPAEAEREPAWDGWCRDFDI
ncbi:hypothetical protein JMK10_09850 [Rhodovulum sulfidophilum]|uniref:hypothetical protein n=1 Tax=Rhodovulum sulfidophilum TaxID=35806 RepID=UPI0019206AF0|nr:hypothetical protein [Rhodovulum sulfidophilum]MBL3572785.1 hypothetical protein [Rhodovulum sulfidophilum]MCE8430354.1 hypothetical protein [Rhodovulum sulfidophilum]MCF4117106.1 hypothetical protein [Rhodovulum sulfidophilum]